MFKLREIFSLTPLQTNHIKKHYTIQQIKELDEIGEPTVQFVALLNSNLFTQEGDLMGRAQGLEDKIDRLRMVMRDQHIERLQEGSCEVTSGLIFIDMLTSFEKIGDHAYNIAQMLAGER